MDTHISDPAVATKLTRTLAEQASAFTYEALPEQVRELARQCVLDYYGVALAGADDPLVRASCSTRRSRPAARRRPASSATRRGCRRSSAALVNGAIGHALDYDDVNLAMPGHPSVAILPGLLALAEQRRSSGREVIAAFVAGYETAAASAWRCGRATTISAFTRPARSARSAPRRPARSCSASMPRRRRRALGIAGTQAAGLKSQFGTMCKPFHAGKASQSGLLAARLAARGFSSRARYGGMRAGFRPDARRRISSAEAALAAPAKGLHIFANLFKYHAACYLTHGPIECARRLREEHG